MTVGELAEQLNELYTEAVKKDVDIENYTVVITSWSASTLVINAKDRIVRIL